MGFLYVFGIRMYGLGIWIASFFKPKAKMWIAGRKNWRTNLKAQTDLKNCIWIHCASLGEFEQGRPIIEKIKKTQPRQKILLTFFSPSGYAVRKNYDLADFVCYLPLDTKQNARDFIKIAQPKAAIFVKYEVWHKLFAELYKHKIQTYMVSAIFRPSQVYFNFWGGWFRKTLKRVDHIFTQDEDSKALLNEHKIDNVSVAGDTRFDRVIEIASQSKSDNKLAAFSEGHFTIVAGSTWPEDENILFEAIKNRPNTRAIIAPHEIDKKRIESILDCDMEIALWTDKAPPSPNAQILVIDTIGLLSAAYKYGDIAMIGGGFGKGIHNTLEAAVYGIPVLFGPKYHKFKEARDLIACGGAHEIKSFDAFNSLLNSYKQDAHLLKREGENAGAYVRQNAGATDTILNQIEID